MSPADLGHCGTVSKADGQLPRPCSGFWSRCSVPSSPGLVGQKGSLDQDCLVLQKWRKGPRDPGGRGEMQNRLSSSLSRSFLDESAAVLRTGQLGLSLHGHRVS
ncbi:hypothetical protein ACRRTK_013191 [Alexandromys fortis]